MYPLEKEWEHKDGHFFVRLYNSHFEFFWSVLLDCFRSVPFPISVTVYYCNEAQLTSSEEGSLDRHDWVMYRQDFDATYRQDLTFSLSIKLLLSSLHLREETGRCALFWNDVTGDCVFCIFRGEVPRCMGWLSIWSGQNSWPLVRCQLPD